MIEKLFKDYCELHNRSTSDVMLEAVSRYFSKAGRTRPTVLTTDDRKKVLIEYLDSRESLVMNLYQPCGRR